MAEQKSTAVAERERLALTPPIPAVVTVEDASMIDFAEYKSLVAELGVDDSAVRNHEFRQFLSDGGITVYDYQKVVTFMDAKVKKESADHKIANLAWKWKPINAAYPEIGKSASPIESVVFSNVISSRSMWITASADLAREVAIPVRNTRTYGRAIPHAVLLTVKKIRDKFKDATFYASDYEVRDPDPFLLVTGPGLDYYVIERWDEPTFRS